MDKDYIENLKDIIKKLKLEIIEKEEKYDELIDEYQRLNDDK